MCRRVIGSWLVVFGLVNFGCEVNDHYSFDAFQSNDLINSVQSNSISPEFPITYALGFPIKANWWSLTNFDFGGYYENFSGYHLGVDTYVSKTAVGTEVFSPCSGIVRVSDNQTFGGYGANNSAHPNYRGYVLVIECQLESGQRFTALLGHVQGGSINYNAKTHQGLAPLNSLVYKGQYVARVASYWNGLGYSSDWHHLHFGIRLGEFHSSRVADYVQGYATSGWNSTHTKHNEWQNPTQFILANSQQHTWHPDGALLQIYGQSKIYQVLNQRTHHITTQTVFEAHNFDWDKVVYVSEDEFNCYPVGDFDIDWAPIRRIYVSAGRYFLHELLCGSCAGVVYPFASEIAMRSWGYLPEQAVSISTSNLSALPYGYTLYLREGTIVSLDQELANVYFVYKNGLAKRFLNQDIFWRLGYDYEDILFLSPDQFFANTKEQEGILNLYLEDQCSDLAIGALICMADEQESFYSGASNTMNVGECSAGIKKCVNNSWLIIVEEILPTNEIWDGLDNDCDGVIDNGIIVPVDVMESDSETVIDIPVVDEKSVIDVSSDHSEKMGDGWHTEQLPGDFGLKVHCTITCPAPYVAHVWYGESHEQHYLELTVEMAQANICLRSAPWIDYNCALPDWRLFDFTLAQISCDRAFWSGEGKIDSRGEGEIWFTDFNCL